METVRLQTIRSSTSIRPPIANGSKRVRWVFVHSKHLEVPNARLRLTYTFHRKGLNIHMHTAHLCGQAVAELK